MQLPNIWILLGAALLDRIIGDPPPWFHPVQGIGWTIARGRDFCLGQWTTPKARRWAGIFLGVGIIGGSGASAWLIREGVALMSPGAALGVETVGVASCLAGRSLAQAARTVVQPLKTGNLPEARQALGYLVGRDTDQLNEPEILRAVVESVAENTVDGVTGPLFFALVGAAIPVLGPWPLAIAYKAASTLDSMIGYKRDPYEDLGWFSARLEDYLTWIPCRLTVLGLALISGRPRTVWRICRRDGPQDPSPNSGWSEAAFAAVLGVQLGGENTYQGQIKQKPLLGDHQRSLTLNTLTQVLWYSRVVFLWQLLLGSLGLGLGYLLRV